uniref:Immunoglobulin domain-containing protein n=1 Tax=Astatotilapia calliptera TaxID=8154 RepID=A0AAX7TQA6_ASTCA
MKMRLLSVILLHGVCVLHLSALTVSAVSLSVTPDHKQFFSRTALAILSCDDDDEQRVDGWTVKRTRGGVTERCGAAEGLVIIKSLCQLKLRKPSDGAYFCESSSGQRSDEVNIIVSAGSLMLDIPSSPVWTGSNVTLLCQSREGKQGNSDFYKSVERIGFDPEGKWILINVQKSDEGLYSCSAGVDKKSPEFRLTVRDPPADPPPNVKAPSSTPITHSSRTSSPQSTSKKDPENTNKKKPRGNNKPKKQDEEDGWYWSPSSGPPLTASIMSGLVSVVLLVLV